MSVPKVKVPMFSARLAHPDGKGNYIAEPVYRIPLVFKDLNHAKEIFTQTCSEMKDTVLYSVRSAGWYVPADGRVMSAKNKEVYKNEEISALEEACE